MKKLKGKEKGANGQDQSPVTNSSNGSVQEEKENRKKAFPAVTKKEPEKRGEGKGSAAKHIHVAVQFLKESKMELKKVKWPTRKELLASTAVVIALVFIVSFFLGLIDLGLIKIIKNIVG
jgi:preprotein translocase subunit SecE